MKLHKKHGLNPTLRTCFWCGENTDEILLIGDAMEGQAPMHMVTDYNPCDKCVKHFEQGVLIIEVAEQPLQKGQPDLCGAYPTGSWWCITEGAVKRMLEESIAAPILAAKKAFISRQTAQEFGLYDPIEG